MGFLKRSIFFAASVLVCCDADGNATNGTNGTNATDAATCSRADDSMWRNSDDKTIQNETDAKQLVLCLAAEFKHAASGKGVEEFDFKKVVKECGGPDLSDVNLDGLDLTKDPPEMPASATVDLGTLTFDGTDVAKCIERVESLEDDGVLDDAAVESRLAVAFGVALSFIFLS